MCNLAFLCRFFLVNRQMLIIAILCCILACGNVSVTHLNDFLFHFSVRKTQEMYCQMCNETRVVGIIDNPLFLIFLSCRSFLSRKNIFE